MHLLATVGPDRALHPTGEEIDVTPPKTETTSLSPSDIASRRFSVGRRGYDCEQVEAFLRQVAEHVDRLGAELEWQRARSEDLRRRANASDRAVRSWTGPDFTDVIRA